MTQIRPELEILPARMSDLKLDERGYPIPWFVDYREDGTPEFRAMDPKKWLRAVREKMCWVCGGRLGRFLTFVAGPMCGINRTSSEPPSHLECAEWSARNCPFLNNPEAIRREDKDVHKLSGIVGGVAITRNPGVTMLWTCKDFTVWPDKRGGHLITMGEPEHVEWYRCGRPATRAEVEESIAAGLPALVAVAQLQEGALKFLDEERTRFEKYLPDRCTATHPSGGQCERRKAHPGEKHLAGMYAWDTDKPYPEPGVYVPEHGPEIPQ